jgi:hypothetical protein
METAKTVDDPNILSKAPVRSFTGDWAQTWSRLEERVRQQPGTYVLMALAVGYVLQVIPFRSLLLLILRLSFILLRPAVFLFCVFLLAKEISRASAYRDRVNYF